jgi:predicted metalloendopeptidase
VFPAGILQPPYFDPNADDAVNYGEAGATIGHEISHGFDDQGSKYDAFGVLRNWWTPADRKNFDGRTTNLAKQYDGYEPLPGLHINGKLTLGENIADTGGLVASYQAWKEREANKVNLKLPGLESFTNDQMFFLSSAFWKCGKDRKEAVLAQVYTDPHSPDNVRTWGSSANSEAFRKAFNCPVKEPTCSLW